MKTIESTTANLSNSTLSASQATKERSKEEEEDLAVLKKELTKCKSEVRELRRDNFILDRAAKTTAVMMKDVLDRLSKLEITNHKRMVTISGLFIQSEKKRDMVAELEYFILQEIGVDTKIDDVYLLGQGDPPMCVVVFSSLQDKNNVMQHKSNLHGLSNEKNRPIYVNDYWNAEQNEMRRL